MLAITVNGSQQVLPMSALDEKIRAGDSLEPEAVTQSLEQYGFTGEGLPIKDLGMGNGTAPRTPLRRHIRTYNKRGLPPAWFLDPTPKLPCRSFTRSQIACRRQR